MDFKPLMFHPRDLVRYRGRMFSVGGYDELGRVVIWDDEHHFLCVYERELELIG